MDAELEQTALRVSGSELPENRVATAIIGAAIEVQRHLGPGLLESAYETALSHELELRGLRVIRQAAIPVRYKDVALGEAFRVDLIVEEAVVVEVKAIEALSALHEAQLLTDLRFADKRLGLLLNFHALPLKAGIRRLVNQL